MHDLRLTPRDEALLCKLGDYCVLSTSQIHKLFFGDIRKTTMLRRLRLMESKRSPAHVCYQQKGIRVLRTRMPPERLVPSRMTNLYCVSEYL